jgi:hypothetical protein
MLETKYEVLARMEAAIATMLAMRDLYFSTLPQEFQIARDEPPTPTPLVTRSTLRQRMIVNTVSNLQELSGVNPTFEEVLDAVWPQYPPTLEGRRDMRKVNARRDLRDVIAAGYLIKNKDDEVSLPGVCYL